MMNVSDFEQAGIELYVTEKGNLKYSAPKGWVTKELVGLLRLNKMVLIEELVSQGRLLQPKVTGVTDQPKSVLDVTCRNNTKSDGSDGCDGYNQISIEEKYINNRAVEEGVYSFPYRKSVQTPHTRHIHHSDNNINDLTRHSTHHHPSPSVTPHSLPTNAPEQTGALLGDSRLSETNGSVTLGPQTPSYQMEQPTTSKEILDSAGFAVRYIYEPVLVEGALKDLMKADMLGLDIETAKLIKYSDQKTAGLAPHLSRIRLVQMCNDKTVYVFDLDSIELQSLAPVFKHPMVAHNSVFETKHLTLAGLEFENINCTMLMANALDGSLPKLVDLAKAWLEWEIPKQLQTSDWSVKDLSSEQVAYAALDAVAAFRLYGLLYEELNNNNVFVVYDLMRRAIKSIVQLELNGIHFNQEAHKKLITGWEAEKRVVEEDVRQLFGPDLNPASSSQLSSWLKENLDEETLKKWPRTKTGRLGTGADALNNFPDQPLIKPLRKYKEVSKLLSTYGTKYATHVNPETGRIHANFILGKARTGRMSCTLPNLQNMPRGKDFRSLFCAPPGKVLLVADYSQIELRVAAIVSQDDIMLEAYENGLDLHKKTASEISGVPFDEVTGDQRRAAKPINFGLLYGQGAPGLVRQAKVDYGVYMSVQEARKAKSAFFRTYKMLRRWQKKTARLSKRENRIITPGGRVRDFRKEKKGYRYTKALNTPIQGGAAEVLMAALAVLQNHLKDIDAKLVNTIHDEIVLEVASEHSDKAAIALEAAMTEGMLTIFPTACVKNLVDVNTGPNWAEAK